MMKNWVTVSNIFLILLFVVPYAESRQCWKNCTFQGLQLNAPIPSDLCSLSDESNSDTNQTCAVQLKIDLMSGIVNGSFMTKPQLLYYLDNQLDVKTHFPLNDSSVIIDIDYTCSVSDYCDIDFVRETLSSSWNVASVKSIHETLVNRLYEANNTDPVQCSNGNSCPQNTTFCLGAYLRINPTQSNPYGISSVCRGVTDFFEINWLQSFLPNNRQQSRDTGVFTCNKPHCASNASIIETFQWLSREYILPLNVSVLNLTTTTTTTTTTTISTTTSMTTTPPNNASVLFKYFNYFLSFFIAIFVLQRSFLHT